MDLAHPLGVVTPTLDGDVLTVLALANAAFTTGQLHRMLPRYSEDGIRKVLRRLATEGIVLVERVGNAYRYELNRSHLAADPIQALARLRMTFVAKVEQHVSAWDPPPVYAALFGSAARGDMRSDSDIDLLLVRPGSADSAEWDERVSQLSSAVTRWTGNDARVLEFTVSEIEQFGADEPVLFDVRDQGITVAGPPNWLSRRLRGE